MATIGQPLTAPEAGWKRVDSASGAFKYIGASWTHNFNGSAYQSSYSSSNVLNVEIRFSFVGTKLRFIGAMNTTGSSVGSSDVRISIDGAPEESFSLYAATLTWQTLNYEKTGLTNGNHTIVIRNNKASENIFFDAIDIDSTGRVTHPDEVTNPKDLTVGKRIRANYKSATSGAFGSFSGLGLETKDFIPAASSATPDGDFYIIHVDNDFMGRKILSSDRNVQHSISWDVLNTNGISSGSGLPLARSIYSGSGNLNFTTRLLTGGTSSTDTDNEWDRYIVNSTLNGTITAGDDSVWKWSGIASYTSTTISGTAANRVIRGNAGANTHSSVASSTANATTGFRPVFIIETMPSPRSFIKVGTDYKKYTTTWATVSTTLPTLDTFKNEGIDDLSVFDRKSTAFVQNMVDNGVLGAGKTFKSTVDLKKFLELISLNVK